MIKARDIQTTDDGDLVVGANGDFTLASAARTVVQDIVFRIRTEANDFRIHPTLGADIAKYQGQKNSRAVADRIKAAVFKALVADGRFRASTVAVEVVPIEVDEVVLLVAIRDIIDGIVAGAPLVTSFTMNYTDGTITLMR